MGGGQHDDGARQIPGLTQGGHAHGGVRVDELAGLVQRRQHGAGGLVLAHRHAGEQLSHEGLGGGRDVDMAGLAKGGEGPRGLDGLPAHGLEIEPLEVGGRLDVHGRALGGHHLAAGIAAVGEGAGEDVIGIGRHHDPLDGQTHLPGHETGEGVAKIARGHAVGDGPLGRAHGHGGGEVVDALGHDPGEVDRIDPGEVYGLPQALVLEGRLHDGLAVVEGALDGDAADIVLGRGGHEPALDFRDPALREERADPHMGPAAEGLHGGAAGVARRGAEDGLNPVLAGQDVIIEAGQQLHGHVLERQARPVEQLGQEGVGGKLDERHHGGVGEGGVGLFAHGVDRLARDLLAREARQDLGGHMGVGLAAEGYDLIAAEGRPGLGHIEPAVGGEAGQDRVYEADRRGLAPGGDIPHQLFHLRQSMAA